jgi:hypothetical protein
MKKVLWVVDGDLQDVIDKAKFIGADTISARTTNSWIATSIDKIHQSGLKLYAWRWPNVRQVPPENDPHHLYAMNEAQFVIGLINSGLDGYIADIECDQPGDSNCWNDVALKPLATQFCTAIKKAGRAKNLDFFFGLTSGGAFPEPNNRPNIPWAEFANESDALFPQSYWISGSTPLLGGTPLKAFTRSVKAWERIAPAGMSIVPMLGEIEAASADDIASYQDIINEHRLSEIHFYTFTKGVPQVCWIAMRGLTDPPPVPIA